MLGKLIKYEFRATGRVFLPMYAILLVMSLIARIFYTGNLRPEEGGVGMSETAVTVIVSMVMAMLFAAVWIVTFVLLLRRFWTNLLGREGYLMNVLPVAPWEHVAAKLIVAVIWYILSAVASVLAFSLMLGGVAHAVFGMNWSEFGEMLRELSAYLREEHALAPAVLLIVQGVLYALIGTVSTVLTTYAAMSVGQLVSKGRVWLSIGVYFAINTVISIIGSVYLSTRVMFGQAGSGFGLYSNRLMHMDSGSAREFLQAMNLEVLIYVLFFLAFSAVLFFFTQLILKKDLNLQ